MPSDDAKRGTDQARVQQQSSETWHASMSAVQAGPPEAPGTGGDGRSVQNAASQSGWAGTAVQPGPQPAGPPPAWSTSEQSVRPGVQGQGARPGRSSQPGTGTPMRRAMPSAAVSRVDSVAQAVDGVAQTAVATELAKSEPARPGAEVETAGAVAAPVAVAVADQPPSDSPARPPHPDRITPPVRAGVAIIGALVVSASFMMAFRSPHPVATQVSTPTAMFSAPDARLGSFWRVATAPSDR